jgi:drug/metabolite transporter (DMT)-like permease
MSLAAIGLVLGSALLHASWNLVVKKSGDRLIAAGAQMLLGATASAPIAIALGIPFRAWPFLIATSLVHTGYVVSLVAGYDRGDLSVVYPVARGTAPILVTIGAALFLDDTPGGLGFAAIVLVVTGIFIVGIRGRPRGTGWALLTSVFIAAYTMIDGAAVRHLDDSVAYTLTAFMTMTLAIVPVVLWRRGPEKVATVVRVEWRTHLLAGVASATAYVMVLTAALTAPLGLVSALRETSVVFGALGGWLILKESMGWRRMRGAVLIAAGVFLLVAGG